MQAHGTLQVFGPRMHHTWNQAKQNEGTIGGLSDLMNPTVTFLGINDIAIELIVFYNYIANNLDWKYLIIMYGIG
jgi:hypothetical protein